MSSSSRPGGPTSVGMLAIAAVVILALSALGVGASGSTGRIEPTGSLHGSVLATSDSPVLTLVPSPGAGNAPLSVNVTAAISGGVGPYNLTVCFGTVDHQSPAPNCGVGSTGWTGASDLLFSHVYLEPGNFSVVAVATDARGAGVGSTALIVVTDENSLEASAVEVTGSGRAPLTATFNETVFGGTPPITLQWTFGDGTSGSELPGVPVEHVYESPGVFTPELTVKDGAGHRTERTLAAITVSAATSSPVAVGTTPLLALLAGVVGALVAAGVGFRFAQTRRWRREGDELVARLQSGPPDPPNRTPP